MATHLVKTTYALDVETVRTLDELARRWEVPKSEALRRAIRASATPARSPASPAPLQALDRLQKALRLTPRDAERWSASVRLERHAAFPPASRAARPMIHLDTSFLIRALVRDSPEDGQHKASLGPVRPWAMSTLAWAEFLCGPVEASLLDAVGQIVSRRAPFGEEDAALTAQLFNETGRRRGSLADLLVAASGQRHSCEGDTGNQERRRLPAIPGCRFTDDDLEGELPATQVGKGSRPQPTPDRKPGTPYATTDAGKEARALRDPLPAGRRRDGRGLPFTRHSPGSRGGGPGPTAGYDTPGRTPAEGPSGRTGRPSAGSPVAADALDGVEVGVLVLDAGAVVVRAGRDQQVGRRNAHARGAAATREVAGITPDLRGDVELGYRPLQLPEHLPLALAARPFHSSSRTRGQRRAVPARSTPSTRVRTVASPSGRRKWIQAEVSTRTIAIPGGAGAAAPPRSRAPGRSRLAWRARPSGGAR